MKGPKFTKPQLVELSQLRIAKQRTYGSSRARVQRALFADGLVQFEDECAPGVAGVHCELADTCAITPLGIRMLAFARIHNAKDPSSIIRLLTRLPSDEWLNLHEFELGIAGWLVDAGYARTIEIDMFSITHEGQDALREMISEGAWKALPRRTRA